MKSFAKVNLGLQVVGVKDNFHLLNSVFIPIDLYDEIFIYENEVDEIIGMDLDLNDNLIYKAINLVRFEFNIKKCVKVVIDKKIPVFAGLGGGSSNAATTLKLLNELWNLNLSKEKLLELASKIGSDVSFFIINKPSYVRGFGEIINEINLDNIYGLLVFNDCCFKTSEVFKMYDKIPSKHSKDIINFNGLVLKNDLFEAIKQFKEYQKLKIAMDELYKYFTVVLVSGSGGSVFGIGPKEVIEIAYRDLKNKFKHTYKFSYENK